MSVNKSNSHLIWSTDNFVLETEVSFLTDFPCYHLCLTDELFRTNHFKSYCKKCPNGTIASSSNITSEMHWYSKVPNDVDVLISM